MNKFLKVLFCIVFFACLAAPALYLFGAHDNFVHLFGWEKKVTPPPLTVESFRTRQYQDAFTESYAKQFFLRRTFLKTAYQIREWMNFGLFHYGYNQSIMEGKDEFLFERPYSQFHLRCPRPAGRQKYEKVLALRIPAVVAPVAVGLHQLRRAGRDGVHLHGGRNQGVQRLQVYAVHEAEMGALRVPAGGGPLQRLRHSTPSTRSGRTSSGATASWACGASRKCGPWTTTSATC